MKAILLILCYAVFGTAWAQQKQYTIALSYGFYAAPDVDQGQSKNYLSASFDYQLSPRWTIGSGFTAGQFNYYEDALSNTDDLSTKYATATTNARAFDSRAYALVKYSIIKTSRFHLQAGTGIGVLTQRLKYPYREPCSSGCAVFIAEQSSTTLELPITVEAFYFVTDRISLGLTTGAFINPTVSNPGFHAGPQFRISL